MFRVKNPQTGIVQQFGDIADAIKAADGWRNAAGDLPGVYDQSGNLLAGGSGVFAPGFDESLDVTSPATTLGTDTDSIIGTPIGDLFGGALTALSESVNRRGREGLFGTFLGGNPFGGFLNPIARGAAEATFNPLSAQYMVQTLNDVFGVEAGTPVAEIQPGSFMDFLSGKQQLPTTDDPGATVGSVQDWAGQVASRQGYGEMLDALANNLFGTGAGTTFLNPGIGQKGEAGAGVAAGITGPQARNIIAQDQLRGVNPLLAQSADAMMTNAFDQFRLNQPDMETTMLEEYLRQRRGQQRGSTTTGTSLLV